MRDTDTLLAVITGGIRRTASVVRSALYPIPVDDSSASASIPQMSIIKMHEINDFATSGIADFSLTKRTTKIEYSHDFGDNSAASSVAEFTLTKKATKIEYNHDHGDDTGAASVASFELNKAVVKVPYTADEDAGTVGVTEFTLTKS